MSATGPAGPGTRPASLSESSRPRLSVSHTARLRAGKAVPADPSLEPASGKTQAVTKVVI
jgi:hypothetical protein